MSVIHLSYPEPEIALVTMVEREGRNTFTVAFIEGLCEAFQKIKENDKLKAVITTGYDTYYACGGTQAELEMLTQGKRTFDELEFFKLPLYCELPTIAAIQGHAIGGGLAFACLHDFQILSVTSVCNTNFMNYGFTPGMGATYTIPKRFGDYCGNRMLFTAEQFTTKNLEAMKIPMPLFQKDEVLPEALKLARSIADKTLTSVKLLKEQLSTDLREALPMVIKKELAMQLNFSIQLLVPTIMSRCTYHPPMQCNLWIPIN